MNPQDTVVVSITDELDLHLYRPQEVAELLDSYFEACIEKGIGSVRIIHGKGTGMLKRRVLAILERHPLVMAVTAAGPESGGWGATLVKLKVKGKPHPPK